MYSVAPQVATTDQANEFLLLNINFICQYKHRTDCNTTEYNVVKYVKQDREAQECSYLGPKLLLLSP